jgi:hypothetical protein
MATRVESRRAVAVVRGQRCWHESARHACCMDEMLMSAVKSTEKKEDRLGDLEEPAERVRNDRVRFLENLFLRYVARRRPTSLTATFYCFTTIKFDAIAACIRRFCLGILRYCGTAKDTSWLIVFLVQTSRCDASSAAGVG